MRSGRIWVGRLGEPAEAFTLEEIKQGAVRESGLFPELYESPWPAVTTGVLATGVDRKYREHINAVQYGGFDFPLYLPPSLLPRVAEDSKEAERSQADIAKGKLDKSFLTPFMTAMSTLNDKERDVYKNLVLHRAGVEKLEHLVAISDDRNSMMDRALLGPLYGDLQGHWNPQVREIFGEHHGVPGKRVKETDSAHYGIMNSVHLREKAFEQLDARNASYSKMQHMDTTLCIAPVVPGVLPLPEQGLIVKAEGIPFEFRNVSRQDLEDLKNGKIFTHDDFNLVRTEDHPNGITLADLKKYHPNHRYLAEDFSPGRAMTAFAHIVGLPQRPQGKNLGRSFYSAAHRPERVVSNISMLSAAPSRKDIETTLPLPPTLRLSCKRAGKHREKGEPFYGGFRSLRELEELLHSGQAFVIQDPDNFEIAPNHGLVGKDGNPLSDDDIRELRRLETDLIFSYLVTMSTQPGAANHFGRSVMVERSYWEKRGQWHPDFCNLGLAGDVENEAYRVFDSTEELHEGLEEWDKTVYKHEVPLPANDFIRTEQQLLDVLGIDDPGYVVSSYGSASSYIDLAYKDPEEFNQRIAKLGITTNDGGGARSAMLGARNGNILAMKEGFDVLNIGIRSETDVSPLEGNIEDSIRSAGYEPKTDEKDKRHVTYAKGQFHILKLNRLLQRQAAIAAMSDCATYFAGGNGTVVEMALVRLHNAKVRTLGQGLFPGFDNDNHTIPMVFVNHQFDYMGEKRGIFDMLNKPYMDNADFYDMHIFAGEDRIDQAVEFVKTHAIEHGYQLRNENAEPQHKQGYKHSDYDPSYEDGPEL